MQLVASRKDERERVVSRDRPKLPEEASFMGELSLVSPTELNPSARVMPEPSAYYAGRITQDDYDKKAHYAGRLRQKGARAKGTAGRDHGFPGR